MLAYRHTRPFIKGENQYIPEHYLPLLEMRPRAMRNAVPLKYGVMPPELDTFRKKCVDKDKYEQLANILILGRDIDSNVLLEAVDFANKTGIPSFNKVKLFLDLQKSPFKNLDVVDFAEIDQVIVQQHDLEQYDLLIPTKSADCVMEGDHDE